MIRLCTVRRKMDTRAWRMLLANRAEVNAKNEFDETPLLDASRNGQRDIAGLLLAAQADANAENKDVGPPLLWAANNGHREVVKLLGGLVLVIVNSLIEK